MRKLKGKWTPDLEQDLHGITTEGSMMYDEKLTNKIISKYGSVENFRNSNDFKKMNSDFKEKIK